MIQRTWNHFRAILRTMATDIEVPPAIRHRGLVLVTMCVGMFLVQLDVTVVNVALPHMRLGLSATLEQQQWIVDSYAVVLAGLLLIAGDAGDRFGHRRIVVAGLAVFAVASLLCAGAPTIGILLAGRAIQGIGAALLLPSTLAVITDAFPDRAERAKAVGVWAGVSALALPAGPLVGGLLVAGLGWRAIFWINLPVIAVALPATVRLVTRTMPDRTRRLDVPGALFAAIALAGLVYAVIALGEGGIRYETGISAGISVLALTCLVFRERTARSPLLPPSLLRAPTFTGANIVAGAMNLVGIGTVFVTTLYLQEVQHRPPLVAGALLLPLLAPLAGLAPVSGRLTARYGPRPLMLAGLVVGAAGSFALTRATTTYLELLPALIGLGVGMGLLTAAVVTAAVGAVPEDRAGLASAVNNAARQAAGATGIALYGAVVGNPDQPELFTEGLHTLGLLAGLLWIAAAVLTLVSVPRRSR
jgi:MFS transporter, DHA2 family, methylenomycin A resistance protein